MSEVRHTPGPWSFGPLLPSGAIEVSCDEYYIADVIGGLVDRQVANARLIASAPELLEALQEAVTEESAYGNACSWLDKARAAISKATGDTP